MVHLALFLLGLTASASRAAPLQKRIAQTISASTAKWEQACLAAGGGQQCNPLSIAAFSTLLAAAGPCEQQNAADNMIDFAKTLNNNAEVIRLTQIFVQQPRNTPTSQSVPYCQQAPKNAELNGLFQCQFAGANPTLFVGGVSVGQPGTIPFGLNAPVNPAGSCPAHRQGPIADGTQLVDTVQNPGTGSAPPPTKPDATSKANSPAATSSPNTLPANPSPSQEAGGFKLQNGKNAQSLNAKFTSLSAGSTCTDGETACINGGFAQCVNGKFVTTACPATLKCFALPLVNKAGTSVTCTTEADAASRIAASGATGGITGSGSAAGSSPAAPPPKGSAVLAVPVPTSAPGSSAGGFKLQNGKDAQALNAKFASLSANTPCQDGEQACVGTAFAQCVGGKFLLTQCGATLTCAALPLVNKPGTSIACTTAADAAARIQASGATGGITGA